MCFCKWISLPSPHIWAFLTLLAANHININVVYCCIAMARYVFYFKGQSWLLAAYADGVMHIPWSKENKICRPHMWHVARRQPLYFISNRQFSMFTSPLSAWETPMEKSQGGNGVLSLQVTTAAWFNGNVCQKAEQQPVKQQAEVTTHIHIHKHTCTVRKHNGDGLSDRSQPTTPHRPSSRSVSLVHTNTHAGTQGLKAKAHMSKTDLARAKAGRDEHRNAQSTFREINGWKNKNKTRKKTTHHQQPPYQERRWVPGICSLHQAAQVLSERFAGDPAKQYKLSSLQK